MWTLLIFCQPGKSLSQLLTGEGQVVLLQSVDLAEPKNVIPNFAVWSQCFSLYIAALSPSQERLRDLMAYQLFIAGCSVKYKWLAWVVYDQTFAQRWPTNRTAYGLSVTQTCTVEPLPTNLWQWKTGVQCAKAWITPLLHAQGIN